MVRQARPDEDFYQFLVHEADYVALPMLIEHLGINAGHAPTLSHMRRLMLDANDGSNVRIAGLNLDMFRAQLAVRRAARQAADEATAERLEAEREDDAVRIERRPQLIGDINAIRLWWDDTHGSYATKEDQRPRTGV